MNIFYPWQNTTSVVSILFLFIRTERFTAHCGWIELFVLIVYTFADLHFHLVRCTWKPSNEISLSPSQPETIFHTVLSPFVRCGAPRISLRLKIDMQTYQGHFARSTCIRKADTASFSGLKPILFFLFHCSVLKIYFFKYNREKIIISEIDLSVLVHIVKMFFNLHTIRIN